MQNPEDREGTIVTPGNFRAGSGVIQSVAVVRGARPPDPVPRDKPGGLVFSEPDTNLYRLYIHMDVGGFQSVDTDNGTFMAGQAVVLTNDGRVERVTGTSLQDALQK